MNVTELQKTQCRLGLCDNSVLHLLKSKVRVYAVKNNNNCGARSKSHVVANVREELQKFSSENMRTFFKYMHACHAGEEKNLCVLLQEDKTRTTEQKL